MTPFFTNWERLQAELELLDLRLQRQMARLRAARLLVENEYRGLYVSDGLANALLHRNAEPSDADASELAKLTECIALKETEIAARTQASLAEGVPLALPTLCERFGLFPIEATALVLAAAPEIDLKYETLFSYVQNDVTRKRPTVDLILSLYCADPEERIAYRSCFTPQGALFRQRLAQFGGDSPERETTFLSRFVKCEPRIVEALLGRDTLDATLAEFATRYPPAKPPALSERVLHELIPLARETPPLILLEGAEGVGKRAAARTLCALAGRSLLLCDLERALNQERALQALAHALAREARWLAAPIYLHGFDRLLTEDADAQGKRKLLLETLLASGQSVLLGSEIAWQPDAGELRVPLARLSLALPSFAERKALWARHLAERNVVCAPDVDLGALADTFRLSAGRIERAAAQAAADVQLRPEGEREAKQSDLHSAARALSAQGLSRLAQKSAARYEWKDIVLPAREMQQLREICRFVRYRHVVYEQWGFERKLAYGKGLNILFSGASGTGKTMAACVLACELELELYKIDLSTVVSKYIGETEKNLSRIFQEGRHSNAMLFFDEADSILGKRSEVKDAHDRYANLEIAYLLQRIEEYEGIVVLATNLKSNMDAAFARRMHHTIEFPMPKAPDRERIWRGVFPNETPLHAEVDFAFLAQTFEMSGGNIRNIALAAAFAAAEEKTAVSMRHLIVSLARELQKLDRSPTRADFRQYYDLLR